VKRVILVILAALVVFAGILVVMPSFIDWGKYRDQIVAQMENATGHRYDIGGKISMAVLPFPHLVVEKLAIAPPQEGAVNIAAADRVDVSVVLMPLFKGEVVFKSVVLVNPDIRLSIAEDGTQSWMTPVLQARMEKKNASGGNVAEAIQVDDVSIKNGTFRYEDQRSRKVYELKNINLAIHGDTLLGPYDAEGGFTYNGQQIEAEVKTGKMGGGSDSLALQAKMRVPATSTVISWSGVVATGDAFEIQGETTVETANAGALAALGGGGKPIAGFEKGLVLKGILTASKEQASFNNMKISYGGVSASGSFSAAELDGAVPAMTVELTADGPVDAALFMPAKAQGPAKEKTFIPDTFTLPRDMTAKFGISAPQVVYAGKTYRNLKLTGSYADKVLKYNVSAGTPGTGAFDSQGALAFGSASKAAQSGAVTLSDASLSYEMNFSADKAEEALKTFAPALPVKRRMTAHAKGTVTPKRVEVDSASVNVMNTPVALSGYYAAGVRAKAGLSVSADVLDLDRLMPPPAPEAGAAAKPATFQETMQKFVLPFDLDLKWMVARARIKGKDYSDLSGHAILTGRSLKLESFAAKDTQGNELNAAGSVGDLAALKDIDMTLQGAAPDMPALIAQFTGKPAGLPQGVKSGSVIAALKGQPDNLDFTANVKAVNGTLDVSGSVADVLTAPAVGDLTLRLKHPNYVELARLFMPEFKSGVAIRKSLDVFATVKREGTVYTLPDMQAEIGPAQVNGTVTADMSGAKPAITGRIQAGDLPIDQLLGHEVRQKGTVRAQPIRQGEASRWSREAIDTKWMHNFNVALTGSARSVSYGPWSLANASLDVSLQDGALTLNKLEGGTFGGKMALNGKAVSPAPASPLSVEGKAALENVSLEQFVQSFSGSHLVKAQGDVSLDASITAAGASPAALIAALNGSGTASGTGFVFEGFDLAKMSRTLAQPSSSMKENLGAVLDMSMKGGSTRFDTLASSFNVVNGTVTLDPLTLTGPDAVVNAPGKVNLPLWTIDMESTITLMEPKDAPPLKVSFKGPLDNPGQTFGRSAFDSYVGGLVEKQLQDAIMKKLDKKGSAEANALKGVIGALTGQPVPAPTPAPSPQPQQGTVPPSPQPVEPAQPAPQPVPQPQKEITPEDVFKGVLEGVLQGR
jgi:uncharacterized protein involved in outer membrane biogenesis